MTLRDYLTREADRITQAAPSRLDDAPEAERRERFRAMLGLDVLPLSEGAPVPTVVTGTVERPAYQIEKLHYESLPGVFVTANLYVPRDLAAPAPGVVYFCGHSDTQKVHYQAHPRRLAELGFVCLIVDTIQLGEARGYHHGCYREGWFHWYSRGYTPGGIEAANGIRALDLLAQRPDVDAARLGVTGISGGGATSWWVAAADPRVRAAAPVCATSTLRSHIGDRILDGHCDCMWWTNTDLWDMADVGALIAPRALLIAASAHDSLNTIAAGRDVHAQLAPVYERLGAPENLALVETPGPHAYHALSRTAIFAWFARHLQNREIAPEAIGDIDDAQEPYETLRVYTDEPPVGNRIPTLHDDLFTPPAPPEIADREAVVAALRRRTFHAFPADPPRLDARIVYEDLSGTGRTGARLSFVSEAGWTLYGKLLGPTEAADETPTVVVALRGPDEVPWSTERFAASCTAPTQSIAVVDVRGVGDTAWGPELQWHARRAAAWTGRTLASMRVWDALRALDAVRSLLGCRVALAARGEMAAVALYAALLDGDIAGLHLDEPPASQNVPSARDGRGEAIEMLNCLRIVDLPHVAGLLFPTPMTLYHAAPNAYAWAEALYRRLGAPDAFRRSAT